MKNVAVAYQPFNGLDIDRDRGWLHRLQLQASVRVTGKLDTIAVDLKKHEFRLES